MDRVFRVWNIVAGKMMLVASKKTICATRNQSLNRPPGHQSEMVEQRTLRDGLARSFLEMDSLGEDSVVQREGRRGRNEESDAEGRAPRMGRWWKRDREILGTITSQRWLITCETLDEAR